MEIKKIDRSEITIIEISGKFDIEATVAFEDNFNQHIEDQPMDVAISFVPVTYLDSSAIGSLIKCMNRVKSYGGRLILFGLQPMVLDVFKMAKLENFFEIMDEEEFSEKFPG